MFLKIKTLLKSLIIVITLLIIIIITQLFLEQKYGTVEKSVELNLVKFTNYFTKNLSFLEVAHQLKLYCFNRYLAFQLNVISEPQCDRPIVLFFVLLTIMSKSFVFVSLYLIIFFSIIILILTLERFPNSSIMIIESYIYFLKTNSSEEVFEKLFNDPILNIIGAKAAATTAVKSGLSKTVLNTAPANLLSAGGLLAGGLYAEHVVHNSGLGGLARHAATDLYNWKHTPVLIEKPNTLSILDTIKKNF